MLIQPPKTQPRDCSQNRSIEYPYDTICRNVIDKNFFFIFFSNTDQKERKGGERREINKDRRTLVALNLRKIGISSREAPLGLLLALQ